MTRDELQKQLAGLVPVIVHYEDHWASDGDDSAQPMPVCVRLGIGFLADPTDPTKGIVRDVTVAPIDMLCKSEPSNIRPGAFRAITYLEPARSVPYVVTIAAGEEIRLSTRKVRKARGTNPNA